MHVRLRLLLPLALLTLLGLVPARAQPASPFRLEARVPASTLAVVALEDVGDWHQRVQETALGKLMAEPEMQEFLAPVIASIQPFVESAMGEMPPQALELMEKLQGLDGQIALALVDVDMQAQQVAAVMSMDFGGALESFVGFLDRMRTEMDPQGQQIRSMQRDGRTWWSMDLGPMSVFATHVDTTFLLGTDESLLGTVVSGAGGGSLAMDAEFQTVRKRLGGNDLALMAYVNAKAALARFGDQIPGEARHIANAMGLDTLASVAYGLAIKGDGFQDTLMVHTPNADHGLVPLIDMKPLRTPTTLAMAPAGTFYWGEGSLPFDDVLARVRNLVGGLDADAVQEMDQGLASVKQMLGVDLEQDLLGGMAGTYGFYAAFAPAGGLFPEVALMLEVKDPAAFEATFDRLAQGIAGLVNEEGDVAASTRTMSYHGATLHLFEMQAARGDDPIPFTPTWAVLDRHLVLTLVPHSMKEIVLRKQGRTGGAGLASKPDFQALMAQKPDDAGGMEYVDLKSALTFLYGTGAPLAQTLLKPNVMGDCPVPFDWAALPPASIVAPHFRSMAEFVTWNENGLVITVNGPIPMLPVALAVAGASAWMTMGRMGMPSPGPGYVEVRPGGDIEVEMDMELARIQGEMLLEAAAFYRADNGSWPSSLQALVEAELMGAIPEDPWGGSYRFRVDGEHAFVESAGPDGDFGTSDDVTLEK